MLTNRAAVMTPVAVATLLVGLLASVALPGPSPAAAGGKPVARLADRVAFGAFVDGMTHEPGRLSEFEAMVGHRTAIASYYWGFGDVFPGAVERTFADGGRRDVLLSWDMGPTRFSEWTDGRHDGYLGTLVAAAKAFPHPFYVRPWPEMNGDWQDFQPTPDGDRRYGGTYAEFKAAWRYVVTYFRDRGATNVKWVFNPAADTYAETTPVERIWPGRMYVDVLGIDGFNWGRNDGWGTWKPFAQIFRPMYRRLTALHPTAPVWICEVASKEPAIDDGAPVDPDSDKAAWVRQALNLTALPRVAALVWFHAAKERDWRVNSSPSSLRALRRAL
jgi:mannan endo-1,4-beta-mannosidase